MLAKGTIESETTRQARGYYTYFRYLPLLDARISTTADITEDKQDDGELKMQQLHD
jgi:hypothetical protein